MTFLHVLSQNYIGWIITALFIYVPTTYYLGSKRSQANRFVGVLTVFPNTMSTSSSSPQTIVRYNSFCVTFKLVPVYVGLVSTQIFYAIHPCHPVNVHVWGTTYVALVLSLLFVVWYYRRPGI